VTDAVDPFEYSVGDLAVFHLPATGYCPEIPGANRQGESVEECKKNLADAIALILQDRREDSERGLPADAVQDIVSIS
jgi:predicted RNase H-like HicB family nuclease